MPGFDEAEVNADTIDGVAPYALANACQAVEAYWPALDSYTAMKVARIACGAAWPHIFTAVTLAERERCRDTLIRQINHRRDTGMYVDADEALMALKEDLQMLDGAQGDPLGDAR
jgi:hypothetical protein